MKHETREGREIDERRDKRGGRFDSSSAPTIPARALGRPILGPRQGRFARTKPCDLGGDKEGERNNDLDWDRDVEMQVAAKNLHAPGHPPVRITGVPLQTCFLLLPLLFFYPRTRSVVVAAIKRRR